MKGNIIILLGTCASSPLQVCYGYVDELSGMLFYLGAAVSNEVVHITSVGNP